MIVVRSINCNFRGTVIFVVSTIILKIRIISTEYKRRRVFIYHTAYKRSLKTDTPCIMHIIHLDIDRHTRKLVIFFLPLKIHFSSPVSHHPKWFFITNRGAFLWQRWIWRGSIWVFTRSVDFVFVKSMSLGNKPLVLFVFDHFNHIKDD